MATINLPRTTIAPPGGRPPRGTPAPTALDLRMMRRAMELAARAAAEGEVPVGAVVYRGEEIVAEGWNLREATYDPTAHAELIAMSKAGRTLEEWRLNDCTLAVTLEPCPMCAGAMVNSRLGRVVYGASDPKAGACHTLYEIPTDRRLNHRVEVVGGVLADECGDLLRAFFRQRRRENKARRQRSGGRGAAPAGEPGGATGTSAGGGGCGAGGGGGGCGCGRAN